MDRLIKLNILFRSKVIKEMTLQDLDIWDGFDRIYPSYLRFPESVEWNRNSTLNRKKCISEIKGSIKFLDKNIRKLLWMQRLKRDKELEKCLKKQKKMLDTHLKKLRQVRDKRKKQLDKQNVNKKGVK